MSGAGKGDDYRPVDMNRWSTNYDRIFGKRTTQTINTDTAALEPIYMERKVRELQSIERGPHDHAGTD